MKQAHKHIFCLLLLLSMFCFSESYSQITLSGGGRLEIRSGTSMQLNKLNGSLSLLDSSSVLNNGQIILNNQSDIFELPGYPLTGTGFEISILDTIYQGWNNPGNLGLKFQSPNGQGPLNLYRFHSDTLISINGYSSIKRYFTFDAAYQIQNSDITFHYDSTELNGLTKSNLKLVEIRPSAIEVMASEDSIGNFSLHSQIDSFETYTLTAVSLNINSISDSSFCVNDTITVSFSSDGLFNSPNEFVLGLTSPNGTIILDTVSSNGTYDIIAPDSISGFYSLFLNSTDIPIQNIFSDSILIHSSPNVTFPGLASVCDNDELIILNSALPIGGIYSGVGVTDSIFDPSLTGGGNYLLTYDYIDINGCPGSDTSILVVNINTPISFSPIPNHCENDSLVLLNQAMPSGGVYSGSGITGNNFDPSIGAGNYYVFYEYTNTFGCVSNDSAILSVNPQPLEPMIINTNDSLSTSTGTSYQWYFEGNLLVNDTNQILIPAVEGNYQVEIFNSAGCSNLSQPFNFLFNSIAGIDITNSISLYPNPTSNFINFEFTEKPNGANVELFSMDGKMINTFPLSAQPIDVSNLENGCYLIRISSNDFNMNTKFILEK